MSIPGKMLVALLSALAVSFLSSMLVPSLQFLQLLAPTAVAACAAVILSHRAVPMPASLAGSENGNESTAPAERERAPAPQKKKKKPRPEKAPPPAKAAAAETGTVKWFNSSKGFGFIVRSNGEEIFVHHRSIRGEGRRSLRDGASVRFSVVSTDKGPQAEDVEALD